MKVMSPPCRNRHRRVQRRQPGHRRFFQRFCGCMLLTSLITVQAETVNSNDKALAPDSIAFQASGFLSHLTDADYAWIAQRIGQNETGQDARYLTFWSPSEPFPSFGIGHFIWLPKESNAPFVETFPQMVRFVGRTHPAPEWLRTLSPFVPPWPDRTAFYQVFNRPELIQLREWLAATRSEQARFIVSQFQQRLALSLAELPPYQQEHLLARILTLGKTKQGMFALIDYSNFKGLGQNRREQYQGHGWGVLDVLLEMPKIEAQASLAQPVALEVDETQPVLTFVAAAKLCLQRRVDLAPQPELESRWLAGWFKRLEAYADAP